MTKAAEIIGIIMLLCVVSGAAIGLTIGTAILVAQAMGVEI